jgi:hypothetical protein
MLDSARRIAMGEGLKYVYIWGLGFDEAEGLNTYCPECKHELVHREYFERLVLRLGGLKLKRRMIKKIRTVN